MNGQLWWPLFIGEEMAPLSVIYKTVTWQVVLINSTGINEHLSHAALGQPLAFLSVELVFGIPTHGFLHQEFGM